MGFKSITAKYFARFIHKKEKKWMENPIAAQEKIWKNLIKTGKKTAFGKDHSFSQIKSYEDFKNRVPVRDYEAVRPYIELVLKGKRNVLWKGVPLYFAKTSGTTSGTKYIPITKESMPFHIKSARNALLNYIRLKNNAAFTEGKMIFIQGNPRLEEKNGIKIGRLSGIVAHFVPQYLQKNRLPSWETNCIEDWETKINQIVRETINQKMTLISGIPPWLVMYFEKIIEKSGKETVLENFPYLQLLVTGGVNYNPYREKMKKLLGRDLDVIQTYPASEGFIGYQNTLESEDLLLLVNNGIFYEFIPAGQLNTENPNRISLKDVELNQDYVLILNTNAGLWGYNIGDTVRFTSLNPYKIIVSGRVSHYTSAFGEHVIAHEVEQALQQTLLKFPAGISEFTVAPQVNPAEGLPHHEWLIEFSKEPENLQNFENELDLNLRKINSYYDDLITGRILKQLKVTPVQKNGFNELMKSEGKLGGQNKVPRLTNDRKFAEKFKKMNLIFHSG